MFCMVSLNPFYSKQSSVKFTKWYSDFNLGKREYQNRVIIKLFSFERVQVEICQVLRRHSEVVF